MLKGFKDFIMRGNVIELATGVIIGAAFTAIVTALTDNLIQPLINLLGGGGDVEGLAWQLKDGDASTTIDLGAIITAVINFIIIAAVVYFIIVLPINKMAEAAAKRKGQDAEEAATASETDLLVEIRDLLAAQNGVTAPATDSPAGTADSGRHSAD
ncbi:large-conductance mechanosensitive channel protein MscL [Corynebacterium terpenotabidum]|uniref:Large-conductance mechanosensitive channel n=1 Tax=Corynebacterium terpenotabidum Y-11 TaxID=1200352 RepID=S4XDS4_9CORY|nr:large-conductance mechanosensitive channel protein MscL [Corynebacterium terpenotabidum]AGP31302.1 Large-conductance mechanosensitive channel [Corynebacterium terpenotabidum Y-11]